MEGDCGKPASPVSRSVARTTMTDVPTPAVSLSPRRLYCCCVNTGASSLTSSTYTITYRSQTRGGRSRWGGDRRSPGLVPACVVTALLGQWGAPDGWLAWPPTLHGTGHGAGARTSLDLTLGTATNPVGTCD